MRLPAAWHPPRGTPRGEAAGGLPAASHFTGRRGGGARLLGPLVALLLLLALPACGGSAPSTTGRQALPPAPISASAKLRAAAEAQLLPRLGEALAGLVRAQPWFAEPTQDAYDLVAALALCRQEAQKRGHAESVADMLGFAAEQAWYQDGLDEREMRSLRAVFDAYAKSLEDDEAPAIGPVLASTLAGALFEVVQLPETGELPVLVSDDNAGRGRAALRLTVDQLPRVESVVGRYPYPFLHVQVTDELPEYVAGVSYNQFIALRSDYVDAATVAHELTHSTLYGIFPLWFEEGLAHLVENYATGSLDAGVREFSAWLRQMGRDLRLDIRHRGYYSGIDQLAERAQGFLFLKSVFDVLGPEALSAAVRSLRTQNLGDQDLLRALVRQGPADVQARLSQLVCQRVVGTTHDYCGG